MKKFIQKIMLSVILFGFSFINATESNVSGVREIYPKIFELVEYMGYSVYIPEMEAALQILDDAVFGSSDATREEVVEKLDSLKCNSLLNNVFESRIKLKNRAVSIMDILFILYRTRKEIFDYIILNKEKIVNKYLQESNLKAASKESFFPLIVSYKAEMDRMHVIFSLLEETSFGQSELQKTFIQDCSSFKLEEHVKQNSSFGFAPILYCQLKMSSLLLYLAEKSPNMCIFIQQVLKCWFIGNEYLFDFSTDWNNKSSVRLSLQEMLFLVDYLYDSEMLEAVYGVAIVEDNYLGNLFSSFKALHKKFNRLCFIKILIASFKEKAGIEMNEDNAEKLLKKLKS